MFNIIFLTGLFLMWVVPVLFWIILPLFCTRDENRFSVSWFYGFVIMSLPVIGFVELLISDLKSLGWISRKKQQEDRVEFYNLYFEVLTSNDVEQKECGLRVVGHGSDLGKKIKEYIKSEDYIYVKYGSRNMYIVDDWRNRSYGVELG